MAASKVDLTIEQGAVYKATLTIKDELLALIDLTGYTFSGQIRKKYDDKSALASFTFTILNQVTYKGQVEMTLTDVQTSQIPVDGASGPKKTLTQYAYDVEVNTGSYKYRLMEGIAYISPEVTRG